MSLSKTQALTSLAALTALSGCASAGNALDEFRHGPKLAPVTSPERIPGNDPVVMPMPQPDQAAFSPGSLWRAGARTFFADQRARKVGDILTVEIEIDDSADLSNSTERSRDSQTQYGVPNLLGLETKYANLLPSGVDPSNLLSASGSSDTKGDGQIQRNEQINLTVAAIVTQVLPNGNLVVAGRQQVKVNQEVRDLTVSGVIRPEDITSSNTIRHTQMAEARISYGGKGTLTAVQSPRWGQKLADMTAPF